MAQSGAELRFTLDTNLLVCGVDRSAGVKHRLSAQILLLAPRLDCWLTLQSLSEFYSVATRKRVMLASEAAAQVNDWLMFFPTMAVSADAIRAALADSVAGRASYWDALLVATAAEAGCRVILTEDLSDGTQLGAVEIHNPFGPADLTPRARRLLGL